MVPGSVRVTVVVAAYNYGPFLGEALDSVLAQTISDWECIVIDDGSKDETPVVARTYADRDARIQFLQQANSGPAAARNHGMRYARGTYLQFLDADDRLAPDKLSLQTRYLDEHPEVDIVYGPVTYFRTDEPEKILYSLHGHLSRPLMQAENSAIAALKALEMFNIMPILAPLVRRTTIDRIGDFNVATRGTEDWDLWLRAAIDGCEFRHLDSDHSLAFIRIHPNSVSRSTEGMMRSLIAAARTFETSGRVVVPLVYRMARGIDDVRHGRRAQGVRQIATAARGATSPLVRLRWFVYAAAGAFLPRRGFWWLVTRPVPERLFELLRRLKLA
jgi:glycosyltransferase involved in cell wall biosynthesis